MHQNAWQFRLYSMDPERKRGRIEITKIMKLIKIIINNQKDEQA